MSNYLTADMANHCALRAMMCSRTYVRSTNRTLFPIETMGWRKVALDGGIVPQERNSYTPHSLAGRVLSSLQFDIWESENSSETVIAFKGTDERIDWLVSNVAVGLSIPYKSAKKKVRQYAERCPERQISVTGHSLGGGLALSVSVWLGLDAVVFNSSPRIFDGWKNVNEPAERIAVFQAGDPLNLIRSRWPKFLKTVPASNIIKSSFDYQGESNHRMDLMAEGIVRTANHPMFVTIAESLPSKVIV